MLHNDHLINFLNELQLRINYIHKLIYYANHSLQDYHL